MRKILNVKESSRRNYQKREEFNGPSEFLYAIEADLKSSSHDAKSIHHACGPHRTVTDEVKF